VAVYDGVHVGSRQIDLPVDEAFAVGSLLVTRGIVVEIPAKHVLRADVPRRRSIADIVEVRVVLAARADVSVTVEDALMG
jgi:hypothetical protein